MLRINLLPKAVYRKRIDSLQKVSRHMRGVSKQQFNFIDSLDMTAMQNRAVKDFIFKHMQEKGYPPRWRIVREKFSFLPKRPRKKKEHLIEYRI